MLAARDRARRSLDAILLRAHGEVERLAAQVRALSPASTLERGYAVVHGPDGAIVRSPDDVRPGDGLHVRLARGAIEATVR